MFKKSLHIFAFLFVATAFFRCTGGRNATEEALNAKAVQTGYYVFKPATTIKYPEPLPHMTSIRAEWHDSGKVAYSDQIIRGWDFDKDGNYDMVEVRDRHGKHPVYFFDFDGDGKIDLTRTNESH